MAQRQVATDQNRQRMLTAARAVLLAEDFSQFSMEAVARKAGVAANHLLPVRIEDRAVSSAVQRYNQARRDRAPGRSVSQGGDPLRTLHDFIDVFARLWESDRDVIRRLHALGAIDSEIGQGLRARNERRCNGTRVIVERYSRCILR